MRKKIVMLPYDFDSAAGIDNYGRLVFDYGLEDIDVVNGEKVYAGQDSVLWKNVRAAFGTELTAMYRSLRSGDDPALSYDKIEKAFEDHQEVWSEAVFNEDAYFKYILPLINNNENRLEMLLGSKAEQRKWWLFNRFKYIDSKYNAGDASADSVSMRTYYEPASGETFGITITPYADIYAMVMYGVSPSPVRAPRNQAVLVPCTIDHLEFTDTYIYSASQIASFGDLSIFKPDAVEFSKATHVQELKFGDASASYSNPNLKSLTLGNNILLKKLDVRNCPNLASPIDLSGCVEIEEVYFDGTAIPSVSLPNGAPVKVLHLPATVSNLTLRNLGDITDFTCPDYSNITTLRIENTPAVDPLAILDDIQTNSRVRIIGFDKTVSTVSEIEDFYDQLDSMRGLDESGNTVSTAQVSGTIHVASMTGAKYSELTARYPYITLDVASVESTRTYKTYDGSSVVATVTCLNGVPQSAAPSVPNRTSTAQYQYTGIGWSLNQDSQTADFDPASTTMGDTTVYAAYSRTVRTYTITWVNNGTTIETDTDVPYGATPQYNGATPTKDGQTSTGWNPTPTTVTGNATYTATYLPSYSVYFYNGSTLLYTDTVIQGGTASYSGSTPVNSEDSSLAFLGWGSSSSSTSADAVLSNIQANKSVYAVFESAVQVVEIADDWATIIQKINNGTANYKLGNYKPLDLGTEGVVNMQIVGKNASPLASGSGTAMYDWLSIELLATDHRMNSPNNNNAEGTGTIGGWEKCEMRTYLKETIKPLIPETVRNAIKSVTKYSGIYNTEGNKVDNVASTEDVWIPSRQEIFDLYGGDAETMGPIYNSVFPDNASRVKKKVGASSASWWLRSAYNTHSFNYINSNGNRKFASAPTANALALGFSI